MLEPDAEGYLHTAAGRLPQLKITPSMVINRTVAIYGPSGTGKTVITKHFMHLLNGSIEQVLIISPSESSNRAYEGYVDSPLIHSRMFLADPKNPKKDDGDRGAIRFLETVWKRQEMMASIYTRANDPKILEQLYARLPRNVRAAGQAYIEQMNDKRAHIISRLRSLHAHDPGRMEEKVKDANEKFLELLSRVFKEFITPHYATLLRKDDLTEDERYSLSYLKFNPRLLLVFDDCAAQLKPLLNKDICRKLFYQNRHSFITVILCFQDDTDLLTNLRKNAFISIFTTSIVCTANFDRSSNNHPKQTKKFIGEIATDVYQGNRKLAYIREDDRRLHFYHIQVPTHKRFKFGSRAIQELCGEVKRSGAAMDKDNPYYENFKI